MSIQPSTPARGKTTPASSGGSFRPGSNTDPDSALPAPAPELPAMTADVTLQQWNDRNDAIDVGSETINIRAIFDAKHIDDIEPSPDTNENDYIYEEAVRLGLVDQHNGPFYVDIDTDDVEAYIDARRAAGQEEPITSEPRKTEEQVDKELEDLFAQARDIDTKVVIASQAGLTDKVLKLFPTATAIELYNAAEDDGESQFDVRQIRAGDDILWDLGGDELEDLSYELRDYSTNLDRHGMNHWFQPAKDADSQPWYGYNI